MKQKLLKLYNECLIELRLIGLKFEEKNVGTIDIKLSNRSKKAYGCCKQEDPDKNYSRRVRKGRKIVLENNKYNRHHIEISSWVMELDGKIIKNTIIHELIHCLPYCNNHGTEFKYYANLINEKLGYNISRLGNKERDYRKSNIEYKEKQPIYKYLIVCQTCGQKILRQRKTKNFTRKYRCGVCGGNFKLIAL